MHGNWGVCYTKVYTLGDIFHEKMSEDRSWNLYVRRKEKRDIYESSNCISRHHDIQKTEG